MNPLDGVLIVSVEQALAAPLCTARLVEAGARVIKIERSDGDFARGYDSAAAGDSSYFTWTNQGKESVVLDFRNATDATLLHALIARADVFIQNLGPGALARAGFGSAQLRELHPQLITVDISGYGEHEDLTHLRGYDFLIQAESGLTAISGGVNEMGRIGVSVCDIGAGMTAHAAVLEALIGRSRTGQGASLAISLFDVAADWMTVPLIHQEYGVGAPKRAGLKHPSMAPYGGFTTRDGELTLISIQNEREWRRFCIHVLADQAMVTDARFQSNNERVRHRDALETAISAVTQTLTCTQLRDRLAAASIAFGGVNSVSDLGEHPALRRRTLRTSGGESVDVPAAPIRNGEREPRTVSAAPVLGADTDRVRREFVADPEGADRV